MKEEVIKNQEKEEKDLLKKTDWQRKTYPLKLKLTDIQQSRIEGIIFEYKKAINQIIQTITKDYFKNYLIQISEEDIKKGLCASCHKERKLEYELSDFEFIKYAGTKDKPNYKPIFKKNNKVLICNNCHNSHYSLRKFLYATSKRDVPIPQWDFTKKVNLNRGLWDACVQKAVETIKSQVEINKKINRNLKFYRERIMDNTVKLNKEKSKIKKDIEEIKKLSNYIKHDERTIQKEKNKISGEIEYKANSIRLYETSYKLIKDDNDYFIKLKDYSKNNWMTIQFFGEDYQKKLADKFIKSKNAETEIVRKGDDFYLQYIYRQKTEIPIPDDSFTTIGIDVNILNLASLVSMNKDFKPIDIKFYSGRNLRSKRKRFRKVRAIWKSKTKQKEKGGKGRAYKWYINKQKAQNERDYVKYQIHNLTTNIIQFIKDKYDKPVIILENLKDIRNRITKEIKIANRNLIKFLPKDLRKQADELYKKKKYKEFNDILSQVSSKQKKYYQKAVRELKSLNADLNNWNFDDFQNYLEYKANWFGIPIVKVPSKDTSIKCNKCDNVDEENYLDFHTVNFKCKSCGYQCNADFNASVNIARSFYEGLKNEK